jgi:hypothetical protein
MSIRAVSTALVDEHAAKQYHAYLRGWAAGASGWYADTAMQEHPEAIRAAYDLGYNDGHLLRSASERFASTTYGLSSRS